MAYQDEVLADSPIAYYRLGETSGTVANDSSGYNRNGAYSATGVTLGVAGLLSGDTDKAAYFDPATDTSQVNCNFSAELYWGCTLEAIVNIDAVQPDDQATIITKRRYFANANNDFPISLAYQKSDGKLYLNLDAGGNFVTDLQLSAPISTGVPHHVVGVYRPGGVCELWIDGVRVAFGNFTGTISGNSLNWLIGASHPYAGGVGQHRFKGTIDEVAIYSHALAAYRIEKHANIFKYGVDPQWANVSALLHMDGANGSTTFTDEKGGTWTAVGNAQISTAQSKFGGASGYFDGAGDEVYSADGGIAAGSILTMEAWVYLTENPPASPGWGCPIFGQGGAVGAGEQTLTVMSDRKVRFHKGSGVGGGATIDLNTAAGAIPLNEWAHVAATLDGTTARIFVNGVLAASAATTSSWVNPSQPFRIGRIIVVGFTQYQGYFKGWIDDARVTRNVARYTANFTPPTFAFPSAEGTPMGGSAAPVTRAWGFVS